MPYSTVRVWCSPAKDFNETPAKAFNPQLGIRKCKSSVYVRKRQESFNLQRIKSTALSFPWLNLLALDIFEVVYLKEFGFKEIRRNSMVSN